MAEALRWIGIARMGGNIVLGEEKSKALVKSGGAKLFLLASDASPGAQRRAEGYVYGWDVPLLTVPYTKEELAGAAGKAPCAMAAFSDTGLASRFAADLQAEYGEKYREAAEALAEKAASAAARGRKSGNRRKNT